AESARGCLPPDREKPCCAPDGFPLEQQVCPTGERRFPSKFHVFGRRHSRCLSRYGDLFARLGNTARSPASLQSAVCSPQSGSQSASRQSGWQSRSSRTSTVELPTSANYRLPTRTADSTTANQNCGLRDCEPDCQLRTADC